MIQHETNSTTNRILNTPGTKGELAYFIAKYLRECQLDELSMHGYNGYKSVFTITDKMGEIAKKIHRGYGPWRYEDLKQKIRRMYFE